MINFEQQLGNENEITHRETAIKNAVNAFLKITGRKKCDPAVFDKNLYLTANYQDENGHNIDFRLYELQEKNGRFMLYANLGKIETLKELKQKFENEGVAIERVSGN